MNLPKKILKYLAYIAVIILIFIGYINLVNPLEITVTGTGTVSAQADKATITLTLSDSFPDSTTAASRLNTTVSAIRNYLVQQGVMPENIVENELKIIPATVLDPTGVGIRATKTLEINLADSSNAYSITSQLYSYGAKYVSQPELSLSNSEKWEDEAEEKALKDAETKAAKMMKKYHKKFKKISSITPAQSLAANNPLNPFVTGQPSTLFQNQETNQNSQNISKALTVTYKLW